MLVAIHQPNFFPWLGYFNKILRVDLFVIMDDVAYPKSGNSMGSYTNRVKLLIQNQPNWISCPVMREHGIQIIKNIQINKSLDWPGKVIKIIEQNYKKAPYFEEIWSWLQAMLERDTTQLSQLNTANIIEICNKLAIQKPLVIQSELTTKESSTDLLIEIIRKVGGTAYLCGEGAAKYQEDNKFESAGITLVRQNYKHPQYDQKGVPEFVPGLSIIDALMHCGFEGTRELLNTR